MPFLGSRRSHRVDHPLADDAVTSEPAETGLIETGLIETGELEPVGTADADLEHIGAGRSWLERLESVLAVVSPLTSSPGAPLQTTNFIRSMQPSLMPRTSLHQGVVSGLSVLAARGVSRRVERLTDTLSGGSSKLPVRLVVRVGLIGAGRGLRMIPDSEGPAWPSEVAHLSGELLELGAAGGALYDVLSAARPTATPDERSALRLLVTTGTSLGAAVWASRHYLAERRSFFTDDFDKLPLTLPRAIVDTAAVTMVGTGLAAGYRLSRRGIQRYLGPGITKDLLARGVNTSLWAAGTAGLYWAGVSYIGRANEKVDPGYNEPPTSPLVSGSPESLCPFDELGQQGRRFVLDTLDPDLITETTGEPAQAPIRIFVGFNSHPIHSTSRTEIALEEMERTGAYDRKYLLLISPTGTGWVDHTMIEATEFFTGGDVASVCIQYGRYPSFLSLQKVRQGRRQFRGLVWGVHQRLLGIPREQRPTVLVFGESLGAWSSSDVVMKEGIEGFDRYSIDRALWFGMPHLAKWSKAGLDRPGALVPEGTVGVFDRWEELEQLTPAQRDSLRVVQLSHDNDPITHVDPALLYSKPDWLGEPRGRNVPQGQRWYPVVTAFQTLIDAANAMRNEPGQFRSTGHDYRADTARFVAEGYRFPYTEDQLANVEVELRRLEKERAERIKGVAEPASGDDAPNADVGADTAPEIDTAARSTDDRSPAASVGTRSGAGHRTAGAKWRRSGLHQVSSSSSNPTAT
ncbi:MAG: alpha/beta-hydrolase family protein [Actinomycetota bacterium]